MRLRAVSAEGNSKRTICIVVLQVDWLPGGRDDLQALVFRLELRETHTAEYRPRSVHVTEEHIGYFGSLWQLSWGIGLSSSSTA